MSKSHNLFTTSGLSVIFVLALAYNFADRNITRNISISKIIRQSQNKYYTQA